MEHLIDYLARWGHFLTGITWIGLLYYFNFVPFGTPASVAGLMITTEAMVSDAPDDSPAPGGMPGGMPDMGGMM